MRPVHLPRIDRARRRAAERCTSWLLLPFVFLLPPVPAAFAASLWVGTADVSRPVWVDDEYAGLSPVWIDELDPGAHIVEVGNRPGSLEWVRPWSTRVTLAEQESARVEVPTLQVLRLVSTGRSVEIAIDGRPVGWTPLHLLVPRERSLEIRAGVGAPLLYRAESADSTLRVEAPGEPRRAPSRIETSRGGLVLPLGAVAFGVLGTWARQQGDRAYEEYLVTVDRKRMEEMFDRAERYDDLAVGFWLAAEALLVASVWKWLRGNGAAEAPKAHGPLHLDAAGPGELRLGLSLPLGSGDGGAER